MKLYCIYDKLAEESASPTMVKTDAVAVRMFYQALRDVYNVSDYELYCIADYDPTSMQLTPYVRPVSVDISVDRTADIIEEAKL